MLTAAAGPSLCSLVAGTGCYIGSKTHFINSSCSLLVLVSSSRDTGEEVDTGTCSQDNYRSAIQHQ